MNDNRKVIIVDWNIFMFRSIFAWEHNRAVPPTYTALSMLISNLKLIGCHPDDLFILAVDSPKGSWRKQIDPAYKANRKAQREKHDINWTEMFNLFKGFVDTLKQSTPFCFIQIDYLEADDIISTACRYYKNNEIVIISSDSDYEQLAEYKNVKLFSPISKKYKHVVNPSLILAKKIQKETTDNLVTEIVTEEDYKKREKIVTLMVLPPDVEREVSRVLFDTEPNVNFDLSKMPFKTLRERFMDIYHEPVVEEKPKKKKKVLKPVNLAL
jgi:5'-3' exonuclease